MIRTRGLYAPTPIPYSVKYGPRREQCFGGHTSVVNFSFLKPRAGLDINKLQNLTPEWKKNLKYLIRKNKT